MKSAIQFVSILAALVVQSNLNAEVVSLKILKREPFAGGQAFGDVGPYDQITALALFEIDPKHARNRDIVDIDLAPRNAGGTVQFVSDVVILLPNDISKGNGAIFYDVNNRGNKLPRLNSIARRADQPGRHESCWRWPSCKGYTVVWSGWDGEIVPGEGRLLLQPPQARLNGGLVRGIVRHETSSDTMVKSMPLSRRPNHGSYPPTKEGLANAVLTKRPTENGKREVVPREKWKLDIKGIIDLNIGASQTLPQIMLEIDGGFEPGMLYELVYEGEGSLVQGTGFASVRDLISFLRHDASKENPLRKADGKPAINRAFCFGVSQSGRFQRHLLYQGFNEDTEGRIVFDGLIPHVAGGGLGFFNHRFAQPNRHNGQHEDHLYPADVFPFTYGPSTDPYLKKTDSILGRYAKSKSQPKIMHTQSAAEYWHRAGSIVHTDPLATTDAEIPENVRIYAFGGTQHGPAAFPPTKGVSDNYVNFGDYRPLLRALLVSLDEWVKDGKAPPPSIYPRLSERSLVAWTQEATGFPKIPGVRFPMVIQQPSYNDYGPDFLTKKIIGIEPPKVIGDYKVLVPRSDADGNDVGTLLPPEVAVPLGTYTGWNLRRKEFGADGALTSLQGSFIPFSVKAQKDDPRSPISKRYEDVKVYKLHLDDVCANMVKERYLLAEDRPRYQGYGEALWKFVVK